jgi:hypothetical protein
VSFPQIGMKNGASQSELIEEKILSQNLFQAASVRALQFGSFYKSG